MNFSFKFPPVDEIALDSGLKIILVPDKEPGWDCGNGSVFFWQIQ